MGITSVVKTNIVHSQEGSYIFGIVKGGHLSEEFSGDKGMVQSNAHGLMEKKKVMRGYSAGT